MGNCDHATHFYFPCITAYTDQTAFKSAVICGTKGSDHHFAFFIHQCRTGGSACKQISYYPGDHPYGADHDVWIDGNKKRQIRSLKKKATRESMAGVIAEKKSIRYLL